MSQELGNAVELRIGGEYRIKQTSLRAGYRYEQSPYENSNYISDLTSEEYPLGNDQHGKSITKSYLRHLGTINQKMMIKQ